MPEKIRLKYQHDYDRGAYGAWPKEMPFPKVYEIFAYYGHQYMIKPSEYYSGYGLFIQSLVLITLDRVTNPLMPFCGLVYKAAVWKQLAS